MFSFSNRCMVKLYFRNGVMAMPCACVKSTYGKSQLGKNSNGIAMQQKCTIIETYFREDQKRKC